MSDVSTQPMPSGPSTLADERYRLHRLLGTGGMGLVVQATDTRLGREVAVKLLADNLAADATARERFLLEARAAARISDPHVVQVYDVGEEQGRPYLVMELVDGPSLADVLAANGPLDPREVEDVAADALAGIRSAHAVGLLHRDVKPGNLLRTSTGLVKVTDFGVARAGDGPELTRTGMVIGTAPYLAPERRRGEPATVRTDLYALGATLHQLLTGSQGEARPDADTLGDHVPAHLSHLVDRLLAADPQQRPASADAALALLAGDVEAPPTRALSRATVATVPPGPTPSAETATEALAVEETPDPEARRRPVISWGLAIAAAVGLLLVAVAFQLGGDDPAAELQPGVERTDDRAETARNLAEWLQQRAD